MNPDDYDDFTAWKRGLSQKYSDSYLGRYGLNTSDYNFWKTQNDISNYDERVLMRLYALERQIERLEAIIYKLTD